jgi:hypothetical protein
MASACTVIGGLWRRPGTRPGRRRPSAGARVSIELSPVGYLEIDEPRTPGFREHFGRGFHCSFLCLHWKRILETNGGRSSRVSGKSAPLFPCSIPCSQGKAILEALGGRSPRFQDDRAPFFRFSSIFNRNPILRTARGLPKAFSRGLPRADDRPGRFSQRPRTAPRPPPGGRIEDRPGGPARAIDTGSIPRSRRTSRRPRGIHPGIAR